MYTFGNCQNFKLILLMSGFLLTLLSSCEPKNIRDVLEAESKDSSLGGIVNVERGLNGTVKVTFRGVVGADSYELYEVVKAVNTPENEVASAKALSERLLSVVQHAPGKLVYEFESSHIPFGGQFCYRFKMFDKNSGGSVELGAPKCLMNDKNWFWSGVKAAAADEVGRIVLKWDRVPAEGVTYEIFRRLPEKKEEFSEIPFNTVLNGSTAIDEVFEYRFPRCYNVRIRHPLFMIQDKNDQELCLSEEDYSKQKLATTDLEPPVFSGIKSIQAVKVDSLMSKISNTLGLSSGINVILTWDAAQDKLTRASRMIYKVYRAETPFGFDFTKPLATTPAGALSYTDSSITKGSIYYYLVRAFEEQGNSDQNVNQKILPLDLVAPVFSGVVSASPKRGPTTVKVLLAWNPANDDQTPSPGIIYQVFRTQSVGLFPESPMGSVQGLTQFEDGTTEKGQIYYYKVYAVDKEGNRDNNIQVVSVNTGETPPGFQGLMTAILRGGKGELRWEPAQDDETPTSAIRYRVYRKLENEAINYKSPLFEVTGGQLQFSDVSVNSNYGYYYVVRAVDEQGFEDQNTKEVFMPANQPPQITDAPTVFWDQTQKCMRVSWQSAIDDSTSASQLIYKVFRSEQPVASSFNFSRPVGEVTGVMRSLVDCEVAGTKGYSYIIRATDTDGAEGASSAIGSISGNQPPVAGTVSQITIIDSTSVQLLWNQAVDDRSLSSKITYLVYRFPKWTAAGAPRRVATAYSAGNIVGRIDPGVTKFVDPSGIDPVNEYSWLIRPVDEYGLEGLNTEDEVSLTANLAPTFNGLTLVSISGLRAVNLTWPLASDDRTAKDKITYRIYYLEVPSTTPTGVDPNFPIPIELVSQLFVDGNIRQNITGSATTVTLQVPDSNKAYLFGVRACDTQGLCENNVKAYATPANTPPTFRGIESISENASGVNLAWIGASDDRDSSSEIIYRIYRLVTDMQTVTGDDVLKPENLYRTSANGATAFVDDGVVPSAFNHYVVRAIDKSLAEDNNSVVRSVSPDRVAPIFFGIKTSTMSASKITLTWDAASDNRTIPGRMRYRVYESLESSYAAIVATDPIAELSNGAQSFNRIPPTGAKYYYVVRALDEAGNKDTNEVIKFTEDVIPPTFTGLITGYSITNTSAQLFWSETPNDDISQVKIYRGDDLSKAVAAVKPRGDDGKWINSYLVTGLTAATSYTFIARASDLFGNEETNSSAVTVTTLAGVSPLFAGLQSALAMEGIPGLSGVDLSWSEAANVTHYRIFRVMGASARGDEFDFDFDSCKTSWTSPSRAGCTEISADGVSAYAVTGLVKNTTYSFVVRAISKSGTLVTGEEQNRIIKIVTTNDEKAPTFIGAKSVAPAGGPAGVNTVELKWDLPERDGVYDGFTILYKAVGDSVSSFSIPGTILPADGISTLDVSDSRSASAFVINLTYNQRYCFTIRTRYSPNAAVQSVPTTQGFVCGVPRPQPPEFTGVKTKVKLGDGPLGFSQMTVEWDQANGSFTAYELSWSTVNDYASDSVVGSFFQDSNRVFIESRNVTFHTISNLKPNTTYYIRVRAKFQLSTPVVLLMSGGNVVAQAVTTPTAPSGDGILSAKQVGDDQVELRWNAPNNNGLFDRYYIFRGAGASADSDVINAVSANTSNKPPYAGEVQYVITANAGSAFSNRLFVDAQDIVPNSRYCYIIKAAFDGAQGFVGSSNSTKSCVDVQIKPPEFAGIVSVKTPVSASGFTSLIAQWEPALGNFTRYQYAIGESPDGVGDWINIAGGVETKSVTIASLMPNTEYFIKVRAVYNRSNQDFEAGQAIVKSGVTTPKAPLHSGLEPIEFLENPGEVKISWTAPDPNPEIGGLFDRYLVWRYQNGAPADVFAEIASLMGDDSSPGVISLTEINSSSNHVKEYAPTVTTITFQGATKLPENIPTCFLVRAAFRLNSNFVMSANQMVRCVTPTASAPQFSGLASLENIPDSSNGFTQLKAKWSPASGIFTRYELAASLNQGISSWSALAFTSSNKAVSENLFSNTDIVTQSAGTRLQSFKRYFARVRAVYVGAGNTIYASGDSTELSAIVSPDQPQNDGLKSVSTEKVPGSVPSSRLVMSGQVTGLWDKVAIFRSVHSDLSQASAAVVAQSAAKADMSGFMGTSLAVVSRSSPTATTDINYTDKTVTLGQWNCYIARAVYMTSPWFLTSTSSQSPICKQPQFSPVSFSGLSTTGSEVCQIQENGEACDPNARWPNTGNSRVRLKMSSVPQGDIDYFDIYMGTSPVAQEILARGVFQSIGKADPVHDPDPDDAYIFIGGAPNTIIPGGQYYFLLRARCLGCTYEDTNTSVSNAVQTLTSYVTSSVNFQQNNPALNFAPDFANAGQFEDVPAAQVFTAAGEAALTNPSDFLKATNPGIFAPRSGRTLALKFNLSEAPLSDPQNKEGAAIFAADTAVRPPYVENINNSNVQIEGSLFGIGGAVTVYDRRGGRCLWIGGYAGQSLDIGDWPYRDWPSSWQINRRINAQRMQAFDGQNFSEIYTRGASPLPRSQPVVAYNPLRDTVILFGGMTQTSPQKIGADTWEWDGRKWTLLDAGPSTDQFADGEIGRYGGNVMAFDPFRNQMVMVGGRYAIQDGSTNSQTQSLITTTGRATSSWYDRFNKVRRTSMHHYVPDATTGKSTWQATVNLPSNFPEGYPAALVSVPDGDGKGLYYFSFRQTCWECTMTRNNVWHYNGSVWQELANSSLPDNVAFAHLYAAYEPVSKKIILTVGRGNEAGVKRIWEYNPLLANQGQGAWTKRYLTDAPPTFANMPCFDPVRRTLVEYGGLPPGGHTTNSLLTVRERTSQDVFIYSTANNSWSRAPVAYDLASTFADSFGLYPKLGGVFAHGGYGSANWLNFWEEWTTGFASWIFKNGFWQRMLDTDVTRKFRSAPWWESSVGTYRRPVIDNLGTANESLALIEASGWNDFNANNGRGRPANVRTFDGSGWKTEAIDATDMTYPSDRCSSLSAAAADANWTQYPHASMGFNRVQTPWGIVLKGPPFSANVPYESTSSTVNCSATRAWRYADSPFLFLRKESTSGGEVWKTRELKRLDQAMPSDPFKFCNSVGDTTPDLAPEFKRWPAKMVWDAPRNQLLLVGYDLNNAWTYYTKRVQALKMMYPDDASRRCLVVEDLIAPFPTTSWSTIMIHNGYFDRPLFDAARGKLMVLSNNWSSNSTCGNSCGNTDGFIWELDVVNKNWSLRMLPQAYRRLTTLNGSPILHVSEYPGGSNEWLLQMSREIHTDRPISDNYILKVTDAEITLRPALPRFGVTLGADGRSGYISVPGDDGEPMPNQVGGNTVYSGRRKFANDILGDRKMFIVFSKDSNSKDVYNVYLDNMSQPVFSNDIPWAGAQGGLYLSDFILGARYGLWSRYGDVNLRQWVGVGNTRVIFDWVKVFDKALTTSERSYWSTITTEEQ